MVIKTITSKETEEGKALNMKNRKYIFQIKNVIEFYNLLTLEIIKHYN